jgi:hypothetical protein
MPELKQFRMVRRTFRLTCLVPPQRCSAGGHRAVASTMIARWLGTTIRRPAVSRGYIARADFECSEDQDEGGGDD